jgi:hypothetical protein
VPGPDSRRLRFRVLAPLVAVILAAGWALRHRLPDLGGDPDARVRRALSGTRQVVLEDLGGPGQGPRAELRATYRDLLGAEEAGGIRAVAVVEAEGTVTGGGFQAAVTSVGREQLALVPCPSGDCPGPDGPLPRLRSVLAALVARDRIRQAVGPPRQVLGWQVRVERDVAEVGEDLLLSPPGGPPARERGRLTLRREGSAWVEAAP